MIRIQVFTSDSATQTFSDWLKRALKAPGPKRVCDEYGIDPKRVGTHSFRKCAATFIATGSPNGPGTMVVNSRGGWSQGGAKDAYIGAGGGAGDAHAGICA